MFLKRLLMMKSNKTTISILKSVLPNDMQMAYDYLYDYFNGFDIEIKENQSSYNLCLSKSDFNYCEDLSEGLHQLGIEANEISDYCYITNNSCICLSENWLPYGWRVIAEADSISQRTAIIHIDDHSDLMQPFISFDSGEFRNILTNQTSSTLNIHFLKQAIDTGAITIGSMLTTIVYSLQNFNIYHLKRNVSYFRAGIAKRTFSDDIIPNFNRIGIEFNDEINDSSYFLTSSISDIMYGLSGEEQCILHIDMDYFNNRYNGSTSWKQDRIGNDYSLSEQKNRMREIATYLKKINSIIPIKYVLIGVSPSFYPSEYWKDGLRFLLNELSNSTINVQELLCHFGWDKKHEK